MATKFATDELQARMRRAVASIGRGTNQGKPEVELQGRRDLALVHIENQILLGRVYITSEDATRLAKLLFGTAHIDDDLDPEDYTADAVETNAEALAKQTVPGGYLEEDDDDIA